MSSALPCLALSPLPSPVPGAPSIPLLSLPSFFPHASFPYPRGWFFGPLLSKSCMDYAPWLSHTKLRARKWPLREVSQGVQDQARRPGWEEARTQTSPLRSVEGSLKPEFSLQETPFLSPYPQQDFSWKVAHWWRSPPRTDLRAQ